MTPIASIGHFALWREGDVGELFIYDQRCPRAHAHAVWSGSDVASGLDALRSLSQDPPKFLPCARGVVAFE